MTLSAPALWSDRAVLLTLYVLGSAKPVDGAKNSGVVFSGAHWSKGKSGRGRHRRSLANKKPKEWRAPQQVTVSVLMELGKLR